MEAGLGFSSKITALELSDSAFRKSCLQGPVVGVLSKYSARVIIEAVSLEKTRVGI